MFDREDLSLKRLVSKYFPIFLAYLFWGLVILGLGTGANYMDQMDKLYWHEPASFNKSPMEKRLELERVVLRRVFSEMVRNSWYWPLILTLITVGVVESWPSRKDEDSQDDGRVL